MSAALLQPPRKQPGRLDASTGWAEDSGFFMATPRILSGIKPTGRPHLGNYFGMMRPAIEWQERGEAYYFIADYHALTTVHDPKALRDYTRGVALDFLACGLDPQKA